MYHDRFEGFLWGQVLLFGLLGAFFAIPIAGVIQTLLLAFWSGWQTQHPEQFLQEDMTDDVIRSSSHPTGATASSTTMEHAG